MTTEHASIVLTARDDLAAVLDRVRRAVGWPWRPADRELRITGHIEEPGAEPVERSDDEPADQQPDEPRFSWRFGPNGRFRREGDSVLSRTVGYDGAEAWVHDVAGRVRALAWGETDTARIVSLVLSGDWLSEDSGLTIILADGPDDPDGSYDRTFALRLGLGAEEAILHVDATTFVPSRLEPRSVFGARGTWRFEDFGARRDRRVDGRGLGLGDVASEQEYFDHIVQDLPGGIVKRYVIEQLLVASPSSCSREAPACRTHFDSSEPDEIAVERSALGFLMVRPLIDGRDVGAFIFDTGAGTNVITPRAAAALGMNRIGKGWLGLAAGSTTGDARRGKTLSFGSFVIESPVFVEMDLDAVSKANGSEIAGVIGYDVLMRAVVEIEVAAPRITIHNPADPRVESLGHVGGRSRWEPIVIYGNHVFVPGRFEDRDGMFRLDTGAPQVPLIFNAPIVQRLGLLENREVKQARMGVPGGMMDAAMGQVAWLEVGGRRFESLPAIFPLENAGAFSDIHSIGNIGQECMKPFRAVFDYGRLRAALIERPGV